MATKKPAAKKTVAKKTTAKKTVSKFFIVSKDKVITKVDSHGIWTARRSEVEKGNEKAGEFRKDYAQGIVDVLNIQYGQSFTLVDSSKKL